MKNILLTLMVFGSFGVFAESLYFSCDTLTLQNFDRSLSDYTYSRNERVKSLEINQLENRVVWDARIGVFYADGNRDNIYEMDFKGDYISQYLKFNSITLRLKESVSLSGGSYREYEYQCKKAYPVLK